MSIALWRSAPMRVATCHWCFWILLERLYQYQRGRILTQKEKEKDRKGEVQICSNDLKGSAISSLAPMDFYSNSSRKGVHQRKGNVEKALLPCL